MCVYLIHFGEHAPRLGERVKHVSGDACGVEISSFHFLLLIRYTLRFIRHCIIIQGGATGAIFGSEIVIIQTADGVHAHVLLKIELGGGHVVILGVAVTLSRGFDLGLGFS